MIDTVTSAGLAARNAARSTGTAPHSNTTSAPAHSSASTARPSSVVRSATRLRLPRFQPQNVSERSPVDDVAGVRTAPATARAVGRFHEHDVGAEPGEDERGEVATFVGEVDDAIGLEHRCGVPPLAAC